MLGFGGGVAYYFMPANVYVSAAIAAIQLRVDYKDEEIAKTDTGVGIDLLVGKEWWVSEGWGVGVALELSGGRVKDNGPGSPTWSAGSLGLLFSATFN
jgi:hypothetical protein